MVPKAVAVVHVKQFPAAPCRRKLRGSVIKVLIVSICFSKNILSLTERTAVNVEIKTLTTPVAPPLFILVKDLTPRWGQAGAYLLSFDNNAIIIMYST